MLTSRWVLLAIVHLGATWMMTGLIWTIHVVHYPLFDKVGAATYEAFQTEHMRRISQLLLVPWGVEALTAIGLVIVAPTARLRVLALIGLALFGLVVLVTGLGAAPIHGRLVSGFDADEHRRLLQVDLVRTLLWTARGVLAAAIVWLSVSPTAT